MTPLETRALTDRIDFLIRRRATGPAPAFAARLGISRSTLYDYLRQMRELGAPIAYCRWRRSYYYRQPGRWVIGFLPETAGEKI